MSNLRYTVGCVGKDCVVLKDGSVFKEGEIVVVLSSDNLNQFIEDMNSIAEDINKSKRWKDEIKEI